MKLSEEEEIKKEFQLERVILFSDAVFAIIITIMVIDIKLPEHLRHAQPELIREAFSELVFKFVAYATAFFLVAAFWVRHLRIFSFLKDYNTGLLALNLFFLFTISLFPFAVSLISGVVSLKSFFYSWAINIYIGIVFSVIIAQTLLTWYLIVKKEQLCFATDKLETVLEWKVQRVYLVLIPILIGALVVMNYLVVNPFSSLYALVAFGAITGILKRRYYPQNTLKDRFWSAVTSRFKSYRSAKKAKTPPAEE